MYLVAKKKNWSECNYVANVNDDNVFSHDLSDIYLDYIQMAFIKVR